jgi:hypothetical protein
MLVRWTVTATRFIACIRFHRRDHCGSRVSVGEPALRTSPQKISTNGIAPDTEEYPTTLITVS